MVPPMPPNRPFEACNGHLSELCSFVRLRRVVTSTLKPFITVSVDTHRPTLHTANTVYSKSVQLVNDGRMFMYVMFVC